LARRHEGCDDVNRDSFYAQVYALVRLVPRGKVVSYGQVAAWLGSPRLARAVGYALHALRFERPRDRGVPWQRVINSRGRISFRGDDVRGVMQERLLADEGVEFDRDGVVDWERHGWRPLRACERIDDRREAERIRRGCKEQGCINRLSVSEDT
jgi:methylated-DNA-protein-cysteine methyltransferase-like protein